MIKVKELKVLLSHIPDDADIWAWEGENIGLAILYETLLEGYIIEGFIHTGGAETPSFQSRHELEELKSVI
jgi:hypothetical protein